MTGVSVIVCCYNSASRIRETLKHLALQNTENELKWEVILVDNASSDDTQSVATNAWNLFGRSDVSMTIVNESQQGLSFARAKGIEVSRFDVIIFCDDDNWLDEAYLQKAFTILKRDVSIGALGGTGVAKSDVPLPDWFEKYKYCYACYAQGAQSGELVGSLDSLYGAGLVIRKEVLQMLKDKKFQPRLTDRKGINLVSGGDTELSYAVRLMGFKLWFSDELKFEHFLPQSRLSYEYLGKLNNSLSYSRAQLIVYHYILTGKRVSWFTWLSDFGYQVVYFARSLARFTNLARPIVDRKMDLGFSYHHLRSIFQQLGTYTIDYKRIARLREPVA